MKNELEDKVRELILPAEDTLSMVKQFLQHDTEYTIERYRNVWKTMSILQELKSIIGYKEDKNTGVLKQHKINFNGNE